MHMNNAKEAVTLAQNHYRELAMVSFETLMLFAAEVVAAEDRWRSEWSANRCAVCDAALSDAERAYAESHHFNRCCADHAEFRTYFDLRLAREACGARPRPTFFDVK